MQFHLILSLTFISILAVPTLTLFILGLFHKLFGLREKYKQLLLYIFDKGRQRIEKRRLERRCNRGDEQEDEEELIFDIPEREGPSPDFEFSDVFELSTAGIQAIVNDEVTKRFEAEELQSWNLLTRTNHGYEFISKRMTLIWLAGFYIRYCILMPLRVVILILGTITLTVLTGFVGPIPNGWRIKSILNDWACRISFKILSRAFSAIITYHDEEHKPARNGICVANHTSPIDVVILSCNSSFSLIGQSHGGFLGIMQRALARASSHIWFDRSEMKDRLVVARRLKQHAQDPTKPPILIFPEGTCINNSAVMQFKKGSFEVDSVIYPVAIKYDPRFGDAFWNSSKYSMLHYVYRMMTSWAIVADVWYLPAMYKQKGESAVEFASRVKSAIADKGGLVDLDWDGGLKRAFAKKEYKEKKQREFSKKIIQNNNCAGPAPEAGSGSASDMSSYATSDDEFSRSQSPLLAQADPEEIIDLADKTAENDFIMINSKKEE